MNNSYWKGNSQKGYGADCGHILLFVWVVNLRPSSGWVLMSAINCLEILMADWKERR